MGQGKGLSHKSKATVRGGAGKATQRSTGVSKGSATVAGMKGGGPAANKGKKSITGSGNFKPGQTKKNKTT